MNNVLTVRELRKRYGDKIAVDGVSFEVRRGEIVGLLGPNGAGKTTTISMILGVLQPDSGAILVEGMDLAAGRAQALGRANFAAVYAPLPGNLTVRQNLRVFGLLYGVKHLPERINHLIRQFDLEKFPNVKCGVLSSGEQTRVALAKAMLNQPHLLLLVNRRLRLTLWRRARRGPESANWPRRAMWGCCGRMHNMVEVEDVCDRVLFLSHGRIMLEGDPKSLPDEHGQPTLEDLFVAVAREPLSLERT